MLERTYSWLKENYKLAGFKKLVLWLHVFLFFFFVRSHFVPKTLPYHLHALPIRPTAYLEKNYCEKARRRKLLLKLSKAYIRLSYTTTQHSKQVYQL